MNLLQDLWNLPCSTRGVIHYVGCKCIVMQLEKEMLKLTIMRTNCSKLSNNLLRETVEPETI